MADVSAEFVENCGFELLQTGYTPPDGYRLLQIGEVVQKDDMFLAVDGEHWPAKRIGETVNNNRYLRRIEVGQAAALEPCAPCDSGDTGDTTTSEQLAEIEEQAADIPATEYTPPEGWRVLAVGELLQDGDQIVQLHDGKRFPTERAGQYVCETQRYIRPLEPEPQPVPVQVCEGRWRTRSGDIRNVTPTPECDNRHDRFPWRDTAYDQTWTANGRYRYQCKAESPRDLVEYLGPIDPEPETTTEQLAEIEGQADYALPEGCRNDDGWSSGVNGTEPEPWPEPQPEPQPPMPQDADQMIRLLSEANHNHVAMIGRLQGRINDLETINQAMEKAVNDAGKANNKLRTQAEEFRFEISYLQNLLGESRQRVTHLEELVTSLRNSNKAHEKAFTAASKANDDLQHRLNVVSAEWAEQAGTLREQLDAATAELQKRHPDHVGRAISTDEWMDQFARDASVIRLRADRNDLAGKVVSLREQLQLANDKLAQLEVLQPIAAACSTAQTMVRDMLGHMRCLLALQHTTDRRDSCTLLESILEVFDDAECDEGDEDDDTTDTSEAGQG